MSHEQKFSEEFINAFVDNQLTPDEKSRAYPAISADETVNRQVCEIRKLRDLVRLAYNNVEPTTRHSITPPRRAGLGIAAALALVVSGVTGWMLHDRVQSAPSQQATSPKMPAAPEMNEAVKIVVQLSADDPEHVRQVLDDVEGLLKMYRASDQPVRIELVMNGEGLSLVRADASIASERVRRMQKQYDSLTFVACQNTIDRLKREKGIVAQLLPGVVVIDSGVAQLMRRQQQGWAYIQA